MLFFLSVSAPTLIAKDTASILDETEKNQPFVGPQPSMRTTYKNPSANTGLYVNTSAPKQSIDNQSIDNQSIDNQSEAQKSTVTESMAGALSNKDSSSKDLSVKDSSAQEPSIKNPSTLAKGPISMDWAVQWVLGLGAVILLIYGLAYLLKNHYRPLTMTKHLKAVAWLSVGQRERIAIIQAGNKQYLIGITSEQITAIDSIDPPIQDDIVTPFADHLPSWWKKKS